MKKHYFITDNKNKKHVKECFFDVINIEDCRGPANSYSAFDKKKALLTDEINISFFEQLTEQISGQIFEAINKKKQKTTYLCLRDRYILSIDDAKFIWVTLFWNDQIAESDLWVKFISKTKDEDLAQKNEFSFKICDEQESYLCNITRFGQAFKYWLDQINISFELFSEKIPKDNTSDFPLNYPDVKMNCHFNKKVNETIRQDLYTCLDDYIMTWNNNDQNEYKIHDFFLIDNISNETISAFIDFGDCELIVLHKLLKYLYESNLGISKFTFDE